MIIYLLTILLAGQPVDKPMVMDSQSECDDTGAKLIQVVRDTEPERGSKMSYRCESTLSQQR